MMLTFLWIVEIIAAILLIIFVLLHSPKGDGLASMGSASQIFSSQKNAEKGLNKITMYIALTFLVCALLTGFKIFHG